MREVTFGPKPDESFAVEITRNTNGSVVAQDLRRRQDLSIDKVGPISSGKRYAFVALDPRIESPCRA